MKNTLGVRRRVHGAKKRFSIVNEHNVQKTEDRGRGTEIRRYVRAKRELTLK